MQDKDAHIALIGEYRPAILSLRFFPNLPPSGIRRKTNLSQPTKLFLDQSKRFGGCVLRGQTTNGKLELLTGQRVKVAPFALGREFPSPIPFIHFSPN
jgi:hypothetical protein